MRLLLAALLAACGTVQAAPYIVEPTHTTVGAELLHNGLSTLRLRFDRKQGTLDFDRAARRGRVSFSVDMTSVNSGVAALDRALQAPDMLDSAGHPGASFAGEDFGFDGDRVASVAGTLTLRGRSAPLTLRARRFDCYTSPLFKREVCGGDFEAEISRSAWGIAGTLPLGDTVRLVLQIEAIRE